MRSETLYLWGLEPDPTGVERAALDHWIDRQRTLHTPRGGRYAVEVCWITDGVVTCRTYQVSAANEVRAARIACQMRPRVPERTGHPDRGGRYRADSAGRRP